MAITTYGELKTAVANWLDDDNLTSRIPEFIALAEDRIGQDTRIRVRAMETSTTLTTTASSRTVALPTNYVGHRSLYISGTPNRKIEYETPENFWLLRATTQTTKPVAFTIEGDNIVLGPTPDQAYSLIHLYYARLTAFSSDSDTNTVLTTARGLYLYASLLEAALFLEDDQSILKWASLYDDIADKVQQADQYDRHPGQIDMRDPAVKVV